MLEDLCIDDHVKIKNPSLAAYAGIYRGIYNNFLRQVRLSGMEMGPRQDEETAAIRSELKTLGVTFRNAGKSLFLNWISPACEACQTGIGSTTMYISLQCPRRCFFCFNPNQEGYEFYLRNKRDCAQELMEMRRNRVKLTHLALTGGEPLLHPVEMLDFFQSAQDSFPKAHTRLYTAGDMLTPELLQSLQERGLKEIRFSIKMEDSEDWRAKILGQIETAKDFIPAVMVEMPVLPGTLQDMKELLLKLNDLGISGINLLEFCYPFFNSSEFRQRGYSIKNPPFQVLYDYWYAGGLPVSSSELDCLELVRFAAERKLNLGVHYCSLENKQTGQIYQQNHARKVASRFYFSPRDYFFKSAKVFGSDVPQVEKILKRENIKDYVYNRDYDFLEFHVRNISLLSTLDIEVAVSFNVMETREDGEYLRELKVALTRPQAFNWQEEL